MQYWHLPVDDVLSKLSCRINRLSDNPGVTLAGWLGFTTLPLLYYWWMLLIVGRYLFSAGLAKRWFYRTLKKKSKK